MKKTCNVCKQQHDDKKLTMWTLNHMSGYICDKCLRDIRHFIDVEYANMPIDVIWDGLESSNYNDVEIAINYMDQLPRTMETLHRLEKIKIGNFYLMSDITYFCDELEEELSK